MGRDIYDSPRERTGHNLVACQMYGMDFEGEKVDNTLGSPLVNHHNAHFTLQGSDQG